MWEISYMYLHVLTVIAWTPGRESAVSYEKVSWKCADAATE